MASAAVKKVALAAMKSREGAGVEKEGEGREGRKSFLRWLPRNQPSCQPWHSLGAGVGQSIKHSRGGSLITSFEDASKGSHICGDK